MGFLDWIRSLFKSKVARSFILTINIVGASLSSLKESQAAFQSEEIEIRRLLKESKERREKEELKEKLAEIDFEKERLHKAAVALDKLYTYLENFEKQYKKTTVIKVEESDVNEPSPVVSKKWNNAMADWYGEDLAELNDRARVLGKNAFLFKQVLGEREFYLLRSRVITLITNLSAEVGKTPKMKT